MEGESHEPEEALRGKVLLLLHATELGKNVPDHHRGLRVLWILGFGFNGFDSCRTKSSISVKEMELLHLFSNANLQLGESRFYFELTSIELMACSAPGRCWLLAPKNVLGFCYFVAKWEEPTGWKVSRAANGVWCRDELATIGFFPFCSKVRVMFWKVVLVIKLFFGWTKYLGLRSCCLQGAVVTRVNGWLCWVPSPLEADWAEGSALPA